MPYATAADGASAVFTPPRAFLLSSPEKEVPSFFLPAAAAAVARLPSVFTLSRAVIVILHAARYFVFSLTSSFRGFLCHGVTRHACPFSPPPRCRAASPHILFQGFSNGMPVTFPFQPTREETEPACS